ncbi:hypothetical protein C0993_008834 [Termitomyces sp. T159_Od127]|nr:hypothetical protein C0993_008834 [Termitomyces sp. T159_Od127]
MTSLGPQSSRPITSSNSMSSYQHGAIPESAQNMLQVDLNLQDTLCALVDEIHTSSNSQHFKDPVDPACSFHMLCKELIKLWDPIPALVPCQQKELHAASNILKAFNHAGGLFDQPTAHIIGLLAHPHVNSLLNALHTWGQPAEANSGPDAPPSPSLAENNNASTHTLSYINESEALGSRSAPSCNA